MKCAYPFRRNIVLAALLVGSALAAPAAFAKDAAVQLPLAERLGFWSSSEQESGYRAMETVFTTNLIKAGSPVRALPVAPQEMKIDFTYEHRPYTIDDFVKTNRVAGVLVIKDGQIVAEHYGLGRGPADLWTSFSIAKSVTSTLIGAAVINATGKSLSAYFSEEIWRPFGMEADAVWMTSPEGLETGGICFSATLRDYGRLGLFMLEGGQAGGKPVLPDGWIADATAQHSEKAFGDIGYGYQWWVGADDSYRGLGIMGQALFIDPKRKLIVVIQSAWPKAGGPERYALQWAFIQAAVDATDRAAPAGR